MRLLAIDPGTEQSGWVIYDTLARLPQRWAKEANELVRDTVRGPSIDALAVEMVASYGMAVGAEVFQTCLWVGRFVERWEHGRLTDRVRPIQVFRRDVKLHLCGSARAKDANVRQALIDRYGPGKERAVGRKLSPGPLYGMRGDCWSALAVAVTAAETALGERATPAPTLLGALA